MTFPIATRTQVVRSLRRLARDHAGLLALTVAIQVISTVAITAVPFIVGRVIDAVSAGAGFADVRGHLVTIGVLALVHMAATFGGEYTSAILGETVYARLRERFLEVVTHLPLSRVEAAGTGDLIGRTTHDIGRVDYLVRYGMVQILLISATLLVTVIAAVWTSPLLSLCLLAAFPPALGLVAWYMPRAVPAYRASFARWAAMTGTATETIEEAATVDALDLAATRQRVSEAAAADVFALDRYAAWVRARTFAPFVAATTLPVLLTVVVGAWALPRGLVTLGAITSVALYGLQLRRPLGTLTFWVDHLQSGLTSLSRVIGVETVERDRHPSGETPRGRTLEVESVSFAYRFGVPVLDDVSLTVSPGERLAIVGASGAGKSTLGYLIAGVYPPGRGRVCVGGVDVCDLEEDELHANVVLVTQEYHVFVGTVADNLTLAKPEATRAEVSDALAAVGASDWVAALPEGLETRLGSGHHSLTPAQAQQLALARIVLRDPHTVVLDEATSLLDPTTAAHTERTLERVLAGRTVVAIAHRLSTAHAADRVALMREGRIAEIGSHDELVALGGEYAALWRTWTGGEEAWRRDTP